MWCCLACCLSQTLSLMCTLLSHPNVLPGTKIGHGLFKYEFLIMLSKVGDIFRKGCCILSCFKSHDLLAVSFHLLVWFGEFLYMYMQVFIQETEPMNPVEEDVPILVEEDMIASPSVQENCRFTRSMARSSASGTASSTSELKQLLKSLIRHWILGHTVKHICHPESCCLRCCSLTVYYQKSEMGSKIVFVVFVCFLYL